MDRRACISLWGTIHPIAIAFVTLLAAPLWPTSAAAQGALVNGARAAGAISLPGQSDTWTVSANAGDAVIVRVGETVNGSPLTPRVSLYDPNMTLLATGSYPSAAEVQSTASSTGTYTIVVDDHSSTPQVGGYEITLVKSGSPVTVSASDEGGPLVNGAKNAGTLEVGDLDAWTVDATAGDRIVVHMGETVSGSSLTAELRIISPTGVQLDYNYFLSASEVEVNATVTGQYVVIASDFSSGLSGSGAYQITLAKSGSPVTVSASDEGGPLVNGAKNAGTLEVGDLDAWTVDATAGDRIVVRMGETTSGSSLTPELRIISPTGVQLDYNYFLSASEVEVNATVTGQYVVIASDFSSGLSGSGAYQITLAKSGSPVTVSSGDEGGPLVNGAKNAGTLEVGDLDAWTVDAAAGDRIVVHMGETVSGSSLTAELRIISPTGVQLDYNYFLSASEVEVNATVTGQYVVIASDFSSGLSGSGAYQITLAKSGSPVTVSASDEGGPLVNGAKNAGTLEVGDLDAWTVDATAGDRIVVRMGETTSGSSLTPELRIISPTGVQLDYNYFLSASEVEVNATVTGQYVVIASDFSSGLSGSGAYQITLAKSGSPVTTSPGDEGGPLPSGVSLGSLELGDLDLWTIAATAGDNLSVTMEEIVQGSTLTPELRLYSPTGTLLNYNYGPSSTQVSATAPVTGTYLVAASDYSSGFAGTGTYRLISPIGTAVEVALLDATSDAGGVHIRWSVSEPQGATAAVERRTETDPWGTKFGPTAITGSIFAFDDADVTSGQRYAYRLIINSSEGTITTPETWVDASGPEAAPRGVALDRPAPNPSGGAIRVRMGLPREGPAELSVFDVSGRLVARVSTARRPAGWHQLTWDGRDRDGRPVASGTYFLRLTAGGTVFRRFVVLR